MRLFRQVDAWLETHAPATRTMARLGVIAATLSGLALGFHIGGRDGYALPLTGLLGAPTNVIVIGLAGFIRRMPPNAIWSGADWNIYLFLFSACVALNWALIGAAIDLVRREPPAPGGIDAASDDAPELTEGEVDPLMREFEELERRVRPLGRFGLGAVVLATLATAPCRAQSPAPRSWTSFTTGLGPAAASMRGDTVYAGSGHAFARIGHARQWTTRQAFELEIFGGRSFGEGDCIRGFTICAPAFNVLGASANVLTSIRGAIAPNRVLAGAGAGFFRVAPTESHAVSPRPAFGLQASIEAPLIVGAHAAFTLGLRGIVWPAVHSQTLSAGLLTAGFRAW